MRGGRSIGTGIRAGRGRSGKTTIPSDGVAGGRESADRAPQSSTRPGVESEVLIGSSGEREQAPPAHGDRGSRRSGTEEARSDLVSPVWKMARSFTEPERSVRWTHGRSQPARDSEGTSARAAASISHATAPGLAHRRRRVRIIMIDRLDDPAIGTRELIPGEKVPCASQALSPTQSNLHWELTCPLNLPNLARAGRNRKRAGGKCSRRGRLPCAR
jgi:hypothetical protein